VATDIRPSNEPKTKGYSYVMMETQPAEPHLQCYNLKYVLLQMTVNVHCEDFQMNIVHTPLDNHCISFHCIVCCLCIFLSHSLSHVWLSQVLPPACPHRKCQILLQTKCVPSCENGCSWFKVFMV